MQGLGGRPQSEGHLQTCMQRARNVRMDRPIDNELKKRLGGEVARDGKKPKNTAEWANAYEPWWAERRDPTACPSDFLETGGPTI